MTNTNSKVEVGKNYSVEKVLSYDSDKGGLPIFKDNVSNSRMHTFVTNLSEIQKHTSFYNLR